MMMVDDDEGEVENEVENEAEVENEVENEDEVENVQTSTTRRIAQRWSAARGIRSLSVSTPPEGPFPMVISTCVALETYSTSHQ